MDMYLTPTFYAYREHQRAAAAQKILEDSGNRVLPHRHVAWQRYVEQEADGFQVAPYEDKKAFDQRKHAVRSFGAGRRIDTRTSSRIRLTTDWRR